MNIEQFVLDSMNNLTTIDFTVIARIFIVLYALFWILVTYWVWTDARSRFESKVVCGFMSAFVLILNVPGLIMYSVLRPKYTKEDLYWADLERRYLKFETVELGDCPKCGCDMQPGFIVCPQCGTKLKDKCEGCETYIDIMWRYCPFCGLKKSKYEEVSDNKIIQGHVDEHLHVNTVVKTDAGKSTETKKISLMPMVRTINRQMDKLEGTLKELFANRTKVKKADKKVINEEAKVNKEDTKDKKEVAKQERSEGTVKKQEGKKHKQNKKKDKKKKNKK